MALKLTPSAQDYLKVIYALEAIQEPPRRATVSTSAISHRMGVSAASGTNMLKKLDSMGLVDYVPYRGASLTEAGRKVALEVVRHHRLIETYLSEALGVPWDEIHDEAEILEHALSEELEDRISAHLGHPTADPHGHPIPAKDGSLPERAPRPRRLWDVGEGESASVATVPDSEAEALRYLAELGLTPGTRVEVVGRGPVGGPLFVRLMRGDPEVRALSRELAESVWVA
ncbi:MAG: metal-dependent transcriptional regulator [Actinomycetota bacterium]|nr:metal-dependent transcriptional regulator [Actinomycetota bacterium]